MNEINKAAMDRLRNDCDWLDVALVNGLKYEFKDAVIRERLIGVLAGANAFIRLTESLDKQKLMGETK